MTVVGYPTCRIALVGDSGAGKTSLLSVFNNDKLNPEPDYFSPRFEYSCLIPLDCPISIDPEERTPNEWVHWRQGFKRSFLPREKREGDVIVTLKAWDVSSEEQFHRLKSLIYLGARVIGLCVAIDDPKSLESVIHKVRYPLSYLKLYLMIGLKWLPEFKYLAPTMPVILIGCKLDLRDDAQITHLITPGQGKLLAEKIGAYGYIECSARTTQNVERVLQVLAWLGAHNLPSKKVKQVCIIA